MSKNFWIIILQFLDVIIIIPYKVSIQDWNKSSVIVVIHSTVIFINFSFNGVIFCNASKLLIWECADFNISKDCEYDSSIVLLFFLIIYNVKNKQIYIYIYNIKYSCHLIFM